MCLYLNYHDKSPLIALSKINGYIKCIIKNKCVLNIAYIYTMADGKWH